MVVKLSGFDESRKSQVLYMKNLTIDFTAKVIVILAGKLEEIIACLDWKHPMLGPVTASILVRTDIILICFNFEGFHRICL